MKKKSKDFSIIDKGLTVEGEIFFTGELVIKGTLKGKLEGDKIVIAKEGMVYADIRADSISIAGQYEGKILSTTHLTILATGKCSGEVNCKQMALEAGGLLNADVRCTPEFAEK